MGIEQPAKVRLTDLVDRRWGARPAGVVDEDVDLAPPRHGLLEDRPCSFIRGHGVDVGGGSAACRLDLRDHVASRIRVVAQPLRRGADVIDEDARTSTRQQQCVRSAEATRSCSVKHRHAAAGTSGDGIGELPRPVRRSIVNDEHFDGRDA